MDMVTSLIKPELLVIGGTLKFANIIVIFKKQRQ